MLITDRFLTRLPNKHKIKDNTLPNKLQNPTIFQAK